MEKSKTREKERNSNKPIGYYLEILVYIVLITAGGFFLVNQYLQYQYNIQLLSDPCNLCEDLNPAFKVVPKDIGFNPTGENNIKINISNLNLG